MKSSWFIVKIFSLVAFISGSGSKVGSGSKITTELIFTCSKLTIESLEKDVKYVQS